MRAPPFVDDSVFRFFAHAARAHVVRRRVGRSTVRPDRSDGFVEQLGLAVAVVPHGDVVRMIVEVHVRNGQTVAVGHRRVERDAVGLLRQVFADHPEPRRVGVAVEDFCEVPSPRARVSEAREEGGPKRDRLEVVPSGETAVGIVPRLVGNHASHGLAPVHPHRLLEPRVYRAGGVAHVVAAHLTGGVGEAIGKHRAGAHKQQARCFDRVAGHRHHRGGLALQITLRIEVEHRVDAPLGIVGDLHDMTLRAQVEQSGRQRPGQLAHQGRPL